MSLTFNADEVFEIAIQAERNGAAFYRRAAALHQGPFAALLEGLARTEDEHERTFLRMRQELSGREREMAAFDPDGEAVRYLKALGEGQAAEGSPAETAALTGRESVSRVLSVAILLEKGSILYYLGLKDLVPPGRGREQVERIIREEQAHLATLVDHFPGAA